FAEIAYPDGEGEWGIGPWWVGIEADVTRAHTQVGSRDDAAILLIGDYDRSFAWRLSRASGCCAAVSHSNAVGLARTCSCRATISLNWTGGHGIVTDLAGSCGCRVITGCGIIAAGLAGACGRLAATSRGGHGYRPNRECRRENGTHRRCGLWLRSGGDGG